MLCLSDMLRAAMLIPPNKETPLRAIAPDIAEDLRVCGSLSFVSRQN